MWTATPPNVCRPALTEKRTQPMTYWKVITDREDIDQETHLQKQPKLRHVALHVGARGDQQVRQNRSQCPNHKYLSQ